jgi:hypothetical protein
VILTKALITRMRTQYMYNIAQYAYIHLCTYNHPNCQPLHPLCSWLGYGLHMTELGLRMELKCAYVGRRALVSHMHMASGPATTELLPNPFFLSYVNDRTDSGKTTEQFECSRSVHASPE